MPIELYQFAPSAPCRMVRLLAEHLELQIELKDVDVTKGEQLEPEFIEMNPQHTIPTMVDDGIILTESRAILMFLANKYGADQDSLYPSDPDRRALVDMRIFFDVATLYVRFSETFFPVLFRKQPLDAAKTEKLDEALGYVEMFLTPGGFIAGSELTIADFSMAVILSTIDACGYDLSRFPEITAYLEKCAGLMKGWEEVNMVGANMFGQLFKSAQGEAEA